MFPRLVLWLILSLVTSCVVVSGVLEGAPHYAQIVLDPKAALKEVEVCLQKDPENLDLLRIKIECLAKIGNEKEMLQAVEKYRKVEPELLEKVAFSIIKNGSKSASPLIRQEAALAAFYSQDAQGVLVVSGLLDDANTQMKLMGLYLSRYLRDEILEEKALFLLEHDPLPAVRQAACEALGAMRSQKALRLLEKRLEKVEKEERLLCIAAMAQIKEEASEKEIADLLQQSFLTSKLLGCRLAQHHDRIECVPLIKKLTHDTSYDLVAASLETLATLKTCDLFADTEFLNHIKTLCSQNNPHISIPAAFLLATYNQASDLVAQTFEKWLFSPNPATARLAAAALSASPVNTQLAETFLDRLEDPFCRINLAIFLITERTPSHREKAAKILESTLTSLKERLEQHKEGIFTYFGPQNSSHIPFIPRYPETQDAMLRLQCVSILVTCDAAHHTSLTSFLKDKSFGITSMAAELLIQEQDAVALDVLRLYLKEKDPDIRLQAAFILSMTAQDEEALSVLEQAFSTAKREHKEQILLGIGAIGSKKSLPFLVEVLKEPSQVLRIRAACAILQCLYH